jgi:hypothetical protein
VVTPITPADWQLLFDRDTVSLARSIGNWGFPCRSRYWIKRDEIRWSVAWSDQQVVASRQRDDCGRATLSTVYRVLRRELQGGSSTPNDCRAPWIPHATPALSRARPPVVPWGRTGHHEPVSCQVGHLTSVHGATGKEHVPRLLLA